MTATITATETVAGWALGTDPDDPFANIPTTDDPFADPTPEPAPEADTTVVEATKPTRCASCHRPLRSAKSIADGRGPVCQAKWEAKIAAAATSVNTSDYAPEQVELALELIEDGGIVRIGHLYLAVSTDGTTYYETAPTGECSCLAAQHGRRCWHSLAARIADAA